MLGGKGNQQFCAKGIGQLHAMKSNAGADIVVVPALAVVEVFVPCTAALPWETQEKR